MPLTKRRLKTKKREQHPTWTAYTQAKLDVANKIITDLDQAQLDRIIRGEKP